MTYGARLAKEIGLPQKIADFIPQHHGTRTLHYFLRKAQAQAKPNENIDEADFVILTEAAVQRGGDHDARRLV